MMSSLIPLAGYPCPSGWTGVSRGPFGYQPRPYEQLADYYRRAGHDDQTVAHLSANPARIPVVRHGRLCHTEQAFLSPVIVPLTVGPTGRGTGINDLRLGSRF